MKPKNIVHINLKKTNFNNYKKFKKFNSPGKVRDKIIEHEKKLHEEYNKKRI